MRALPLLVIASTLGCVTAPTPPPSAPAPSQPAPAAQTTPPPPPKTEPPAPPAQPPEVAGPLPWVNPGRCLSPCAYDPTAKLVRIDEQGRIDDKGPHRVEGAVLAPLQALLEAAHNAGH